MKDILPEVLAELQKYKLTFCFLFRFFDGTDYYRYTDLDVPVYYADDSTSLNKFEVRDFKFTRIGYSMSNIVDDCQVEIENRDSIMTAIFSTSDDFQGENGKIWLCLLNDVGQVIGTIVMFSGLLDSFVLTEENIEISLVTLFYNWDKSVGHRQPGRCRYPVFGGTQCKYSGSATTCDRRYTTCLSYNNDQNFGGFRWLADLQNKEFQWGPGGEIHIL